MENIRIIPRLDIKGPNLVKGIHLEGLRVIGKPETFARYYYEQGADELFFQDSVASLYERNSLNDIISRTAREIFIPLTVGGGIRTIEDIRNVLRAGADKVSINTAAVKNPKFISEAAERFGSSTIVVAIEAIRQPDGSTYLAYTDNGREYTGLEVTAWAHKAAELGAGEILITSVDQEGTGKGFDLGLVKSIASAVSVPVIAHGGAGSPQDIADIAAHGDVSGVALASVLHYGLVQRLVHEGIDFSAEGNIAFIASGRSFGKIKPVELQEVKRFLASHDIPVRL